MSYADYLATPEWGRIRSQILDGGVACLLCPRPASQVHHTDYEWDTLLGVCLDGLVPLCRSCHKRIEFTSDGTKRTLGQANHALRLAVVRLKTGRALAWLRTHRRRRREATRVQRRVVRGQVKRDATNRKKQSGASKARKEQRDSSPQK